MMNFNPPPFKLKNLQSTGKGTVFYMELRRIFLTNLTNIESCFSQAVPVLKIPLEIPVRLLVLLSVIQYI
jgi:hypothetical protein